MKSPVPYYTDAQFTALPVQERALIEASSQVGVEEVPRGSNWGPRVALYLKAAGIFSPAYWCAAFVTWCLVAVGVKRSSLPLLAGSTAAWIKWAQANGRILATPERGCLFCWNGHIGFVGDVRKVDFDTFEGNTNTGGSRNGYKVAKRSRTRVGVRSMPQGCFISLKGLS